jgi:hypothetical protein
MKPFNLQAAIDGAPIRDSKGAKIKFVAHVPEASEEEQIVYLSSDLCVRMTSVAGAIFYFYMSPVFKKYWVNINKRFSGEPYFGIPFDNEAEAMRAADCTGGYIKTISFEIEE